jgi:hypothetical protein
MIAVVGRLDSGPADAIARRAAALGAPVELVAKVAPGGDGDARLATLAAAGVRHAAALRSSAAALEPADLDLALRYLPEVRVIVLAGEAATLGPTAAEAAAWSNAALIVVIADGEAPDVTDDRATVLVAPASDPDAAFAGFVADLAVRLDAGEAPLEAWRTLSALLGLEAVSAAAPRPSPR